MTDKPRAKLTPKQQELLREMREMDKAARQEAERAPCKPSSWETACSVVAVVVLILVTLGLWVYVSVMRGLGEGLGEAIFRGWGGHG